LRGRPWDLCLNDDCPSMQEMKRRRAEREAAKAEKEAAVGADGKRADRKEAAGNGADSKADAAKLAGAASATRTRRRGSRAKRAGSKR
jgi:hypothetical protein